MSVINKVLRDLDQRQVESGTPTTGSPEVRVVAAKSDGHEWFWRILASLALVALGWVAWVVYQIQPRPLATELAHKAATKKLPVEVAKAPPSVPPAVSPAPVPPPAVSAPTPPVAAPAPEPQKPIAIAPAPAASKPAAAPDAMRFAYSIETPIGSPVTQAAEKPAPESSKKAPVGKPRNETPKKAAAEKPRVERRDVALSPAARADNEFRRGVDLLKRGRMLEAERTFAAALRIDPKSRGPRQALVALKLERGELDEARRLLEEALTADPAQPEFAVALARIHVERNSPQAALTVLDASAGAAAELADFHFLRGAVLQRLGRHAEAADAYRAALRVQTTLPQAWMGLGISLEALEQRKAAAEAFRNGLAAGPVSSELRTFMQQRIQALR